MSRTETICDLFNRGWSYNHIAAEVGITKNAVAGIIHRNRHLIDAPVAIADADKDAVFCEAIAEGATLSGAGRLISVGRAAATERFKRIRRELGAQAV